ncbi:MAG: tetratricopeptide repeat protein [Desulfobacterales bacterium]
MKNKTEIISVILLLIILVGCATSGPKSPETLAREYTAKAKQYEEKGDLVEALNQYKLVLTVDPENKLAREKRATLEPQFQNLAEEHYKNGVKFYNKGEYPQARKEFLTALRYNPEHANAKAKLTATSKDLGRVKRYIVHTVQADESISTLAERYYGDYRKFHFIAEYNELEDATQVRVGQDIKIPVIEDVPIIADPAAIQTDPGETAEPLPGEIIAVKRFIIHTVQPEESLSKLAKMYYGDLTKFDVIAKFNDILDGTSVRVGQKLKIPEVEGLPFLVEGEMEETKTVSLPKDRPVSETEAEKPQEPKIVKKPITVESQTANYRELGIEFYKNKEYSDAIIELNKVINVTPDDQTARNYLALAYFEKGRRSFDNKAYSQAETEFEASLKYDKNCPDCRKYMDKIEKKRRESLRDEAISLYNEKKFKEAIAKFEGVVKNNPKDSGAVEYLGKSHFQQGLILFGKEEYLAARDEFKTALEYDKKCDQCEKNIKKCEDTFKEVHYDKGLAYFGDQKLAEAIREWESVSALDPNYKDVNKNLTKAKTLYERLESIKRSKVQENTQ